MTAKKIKILNNIDGDVKLLENKILKNFFIETNTKS